MLNFVENVQKEEERIDSMDTILGKGAMMPNNVTNSGARKIMQSTQLEHAMPLLTPELPLLQTGFENEFGKYASSVVKTESPYRVVDVFQRYENYKNHHYFILIQDLKTGVYDIIERVSYKYTTESYGYIYNNSDLDNMAVPGNIIPEDTIIRKSLAYDQFNNRIDGVNLLTTYLACEFTKEDSIILSETAARKLSVPLVKYVTIPINENNIPLNLYGDDNIYKIIPDIAEDIKGGNICALRSEKNEEALYMQDRRRLRTPMMSDEVFSTNEGKIYDIKVRCNNKENLNSPYLSQIKYYYEQEMKFNSNLVYSVGKLINTAPCSYKLENMYYDCKKILEGGKFIKDRVFSNIVLELVIIEPSPVGVGDKISNRYGGKGVVSKILPDEEMPMLDNGQHVEQILNPAGMPNRENPGQSLEVCFNFCGSRLIDYMDSKVLSDKECLDLYLDYLKLVDPREFLYVYENYITNFDDQCTKMFMEGVKEQGIVLSLLPVTETMDIDLLNSVYKHFQMIKPYKVYITIQSSTGQPRMVECKRRLIVGKQYTYRLKQYAEEKFSTTALSSTNIKNENSRNQDKKNFKSPHAKTPIRFGYMETGDLGHIGMEATILNLLINSASPHGRRLVEQLFTGDPFNVDIQLDSEAKNRGVEILNAYLTTMGLRLEFKKIPKVYNNAITMDVLQFYQMQDGIKDALWFFDKNEKLYLPNEEENFRYKPAILMEAIKPVGEVEKEIIEELYKKYYEEKDDENEQ